MCTFSSRCLYLQCKYIAFINIILSLTSTYGVSGIRRRFRASRKSEFSRCTTIRRCTAARWRCCSNKSSIACKTSHDRIFRTANRSVLGLSDRLWNAKRTVIIIFIDYYHSYKIAKPTATSKPIVHNIFPRVSNMGKNLTFTIHLYKGPHPVNYKFCTNN